MRSSSSLLICWHAFISTLPVCYKRHNVFCACIVSTGQVVDRLSSDNNGELLLQPIGYCKELVDGLAAMAIDRELPLERRTDSARTLLGITQKAANANIVFVNPRTVRPFTGYCVAFRESPELG